MNPLITLVLVLIDAPNEIARDADVERSVSADRQDVDPVYAAVRGYGFRAPAFGRPRNDTSLRLDLDLGQHLAPLLLLGAHEGGEIFA